MQKASVWAEKIMIPTYEIGEAEKNPIFLEKRVYQGSSGKVYPYPTIEKISDEKKDKEYTAVWLENEYMKVMVLPELGGRIQRAYDKTNGYDFVYYNHVIKPALVGLTGPWISGGIEFNWPQHHRPTTFLPVDYEIQENEDGSASVLCHDVDQMYGTKGLMRFTVYPGKAYIEIKGQLYNRTPLPQTFLWWANPAVPVNDNTQSIFPPDVHAVMDHGKRDVSRFPIATGVYYKKDYSEGVDISRYKNIPVPTSYMAEKSKYDFVGGYDYGKSAGILHVADHHVSPGKKQWTWGCGDFGKAWDRNLTDEDGPYVELMTGMFTDNQPDFTWLKPFEEKTFTQYFMPYKEVGQVKNASKKAAVHLSLTKAADGSDVAKVIVYATSAYENARVVLTHKGAVVLDERADISPVQIFEKTVTLPEHTNGERLNEELNEKLKEELKAEEVKEEELKIEVFAQGRSLIAYQPEAEEIPTLPEPAKAAEEPSKIMTNEELYLTGQHIEQYRHATWRPDPYYLEGLKRDPGDIRINNAYGMLLMRRGLFEEAEPYFRTAIKRLTWKNPNPYNSEAYYLLGLDLCYQGRDDEAYDAFYKAAWSNEQQEMSFYYLAAIAAKKGQFETALEHVEKSLVKNSHNIKARGLKAWLLAKLEKAKAAARMLEDNLELDPFDFVSGFEAIKAESDLEKKAQMLAQWNALMRDFQENYLMTARDYAQWGAYKDAISVLEQCTKQYPMLYYYEAFYENKLGKTEEAKKCLDKAEACAPDYCFPNKLDDIAVLTFAIGNGCTKKAPYYLGNLFYDKLQWKKSVALWEQSEAEDDTFPIVHRNLALAYYNKMGDAQAAKRELERAFDLNRKDARIFLELDQLYKKLDYSFEARLANYDKDPSLAESRDDLYIEYITLMNMCGEYERAYNCIMGRRFHPWEGGEGKVTTQYTIALLEMAKKCLKKGKESQAEGKENQANAEDEKAAYEKAEELLRRALVYPENLGEGKLEGTKDNHLYYHLGLALEAQGKSDEARKCFETATVGTDEPAGAMYYNDQPADMILYQGLAFEKLGKTREAKSRFYRLIDYGEQHLNDEGKIEYFAVSLPDFLIFDEDYTKKNRAHCCYLMALGNIGLQNYEKAAEFLKDALTIEPSHMMATLYQKSLEEN